jgi:hypothetical protein
MREFIPYLSCYKRREEHFVVQKTIGGSCFVLFALSVFFLLGGGCGSGSGGKIESVSTSTAATIPDNYQQTNNPDPDVTSIPTTSSASSSPTTTQSISYTVFEWDAPTTYGDGSSIVPDDIREYRMYYGSVSRHSPIFTNYIGHIQIVRSAEINRLGQELRLDPDAINVTCDFSRAFTHLKA